MPVKVLIQHNTSYTYDKPVALSPQIIRLNPSPHSRTPVSHYALKLSPPYNIVHTLQDPFGNTVTRVNFQGLVRQLNIGVEMEALIELVNPFDFFIDDDAANFPFKYSSRYQHFLSLYLEITDGADKAIDRWLKQIDYRPQNIVAFIAMINKLLHHDISYRERLEPGVQSPAESLTRKTGSCRDSAWLLVQVFRTLKIAARFVSGYLVQLGNEDSAGLHAWTEVYIPGAGWIGLDPSTGLFAAKGYIPLACSPGVEDAAPLTGTSDIAGTTLQYSSTITRL